MPYFAEYDKSIVGPSPVLAWYDVHHEENNPNGMVYPKLPENDRLFELDAEQWESHFTDPSGWAIDANRLVRHSKLPSAAALQAGLKADATAWLKHSDGVVMRFYEEGVPLSDKWKEYRKTLRDIMESGVGELPEIPAAPIFG
jgi:hypothetical protein